MAARTIGGISRSHRERAPHERRLFSGLHQSGQTAEREFFAFAERTNLLEDLARAAAETGVEIDQTPAAEKSLIIRATKASADEIEKIVDKALRGSGAIWDRYEVAARTDLLTETVSSFEAGATGPLRQIGFQGTFNLQNPRVLDYFTIRANQLSGAVSDTTFEAIRQQLIQGFFHEGKHPFDVAKTLQKEFDFLSAARARNIARTETGIAQSQGSFEQMYQLGALAKNWLATRDNATRPDHRDAGERYAKGIPLEEPFIVGGVEMMHPLDPTAPPEQICSCRCDSGAIVNPATATPWTGGDAVRGREVLREAA